MNNIIETQNYYNANAGNIISLNRWEFFLYLLLAFIIGYLIHYIFSSRRDYIRTPKKKAFYYNNNLSGGYYSNSEPILPRKIVQNHVVASAPTSTAPAPVQYTAPQTHVPAPKPVVKKVTIKSTKDDLKKIEGIGPKIEELLNNAGIHTWHALSKKETTNLKSILEQAGKRFQMHDPSTWSEQAHLAETGQWDALQEYQDFLNGGKHI
ncbi:MAG: hypothetical protein LR005_00420 [Candidatus Pacebacteria bacterium]|nr:hypothetical protein [Candidatus Paceibacterota bacterium]